MQQNMFKELDKLTIEHKIKQKYYGLKMPLILFIEPTVILSSTRRRFKFTEDFHVTDARESTYAVQHKQQHPCYRRQLRHFLKFFSTLSSPFKHNM